MKRGDLILTPDGYYGIYLELDYGIHLEKNDVFLGNGTRVTLTKDELDKCVAIPIRHGIPMATANFAEVLQSTKPKET